MVIRDKLIGAIIGLVVVWLMWSGLAWLGLIVFFLIFGVIMFREFFAIRRSKRQSENYEWRVERTKHDRPNDV